MGGRPVVARAPLRRRHLRGRRGAPAMGPAPVGHRQPRERAVERADVPGLEAALPGIGDAHRAISIIAGLPSAAFFGLVRNNPMQSTFRSPLLRRAVILYLGIA